MYQNNKIVFKIVAVYKKMSQKMKFHLLFFIPKVNTLFENKPRLVLVGVCQESSEGIS